MPVNLENLGELLNPEQLASKLTVTPGTLATWRHAGTGPDYVRLTGKIRYRRADVDAWLATRVRARKGA